ncbi:MAG: hypothetical protein WC655_00150 [Candidatus Hydrogenedentales bacterium]|jgi:hypothetical protein
MTETRHGIPYPDPMPSPTPEHQRRISKQKWFEVATVLLLIAAGFGFLGWRDYRAHHRTEPAKSLEEASKAIESAGCAPAGTAKIFNRHFLSYRQQLEDFECHVNLVGVEPGLPLETAVIWLTPKAGQAPASEESLQKAVNSVGVLGQTLVASSSQALEAASKTMEFLSDAKRPHDKGVAGTTDGWKLTYVTYREYDADGAPEPVLCMVLQSLSAASESTLADFNRTMYEAIHQGVDVETALRAEAEGKSGA